MGSQRSKVMGCVFVEAASRTEVPLSIFRWDVPGRAETRWKKPKRPVTGALVLPHAGNDQFFVAFFIASDSTPYASTHASFTSGVKSLPIDCSSAQMSAAPKVL